MFHSRRLNNKINSIHERALRITYQDNKRTFLELLNKDNSISIHHRNFQFLATEMFNILQGLTPDILRETFMSKASSYNLAKTILSKNVKCTLYLTVLDRYRFRPENIGFSTSAIETIREP